MLKPCNFITGFFYVICSMETITTTDKIRKGTISRVKKIKQEYHKLTKVDFIQTAKAREKLADKHDVEPDTIYLMIAAQGYYSNPLFAL